MAVCTWTRSRSTAHRRKRVRCFRLPRRAVQRNKHMRDRRLLVGLVFLVLVGCTHLGQRDQTQPVFRSPGVVGTGATVANPSSEQRSRGRGCRHLSPRLRYTSHLPTRHRLFRRRSTRTHHNPCQREPAPLSQPTPRSPPRRLCRRVRRCLPQPRRLCRPGLRCRNRA
jgi:hypothetical protein